MDEHYLSRLRGDMPDDAVDIWHLPLHLDRALWTVLTEAERTRARNIKIIEKRVQFVAGRAQLRHILASYLRCRPGSLQLEVGEHGKPWVQSDPPLSFNLSHSRDAGLLAVTVGQPVSLGVDLEFRKPDRRFQQIATRFFSQAEQQELLARPSAELTPAFYQAWACKEAYLKACGTGLSFPSNQFTIRCDSNGAAELLESQMPGPPRSWHFHPIAADGDYAAALCYSGKKRWLRHFLPGATPPP